MIQIRLFKAKESKNLEGIVNRELQSIQANPNVDPNSFKFELNGDTVLVSYDIKVSKTEPVQENRFEGKTLLDIIVEGPKNG